MWCAVPRCAVEVWCRVVGSSVVVCYRVLSWCSPLSHAAVCCRALTMLSCADGVVVSQCGFRRLLAVVDPARRSQLHRGCACVCSVHTAPHRRLALHLQRRAGLRLRQLHGLGLSGLRHATVTRRCGTDAQLHDRVSRSIWQRSVRACCCIVHVFEGVNCRDRCLGSMGLRTFCSCVLSLL